MTTAEKLTIERKEFLLTKYINWNQTLQDALMNDFAFDDDALETIKSGRNAAAKIQAFVENAKAVISRREESVVTLADILERTRLSFIPDWNNVWLCAELREELRADRDELTISPVIKYEAGQIVHRGFGHGKKLAEWDKRRCVGMVCRVTQTTNNVWSAVTDCFLVDIQAETEVLNSKTEICDKLDDTVLKFNAAIQDQIYDSSEHSRNLGGSTSSAFVPQQQDAPDQSNNPGRPLEKVDNSVNKLITLLGQNLLHTDLLRRERERVLDMLEIKEKHTSHLQGELEKAIQKMVDEHKKAEAFVRRREERYKEKLAELEAELAKQAKLSDNAEKTIETKLVQYVNNKHAIFDKEEQLAALKKQVKLARAENKETRERYGFMERDLRLNVIIKRDGRKSPPSKKPTKFPSIEDPPETPEARLSKASADRQSVSFPDIPQKERSVKFTSPENSATYRGRKTRQFPQKTIS